MLRRAATRTRALRADDDGDDDDDYDNDDGDDDDDNVVRQTGCYSWFPQNNGAPRGTVAQTP